MLTFEDCLDIMNMVEGGDREDESSEKEANEEN